MVRDVHILNSAEESTLAEFTSGAEFHPHVRIVQSIHHFTNHIPSNDRGIVKKVCLDVTDIRVLRVDPRRLLGCYLPDYQHKERILLRMVYETHFVKSLEMNIHISSKYNDKQNEISAKLVANNCPIAYRFVDIEVSKQGVINNIHFLPVEHKIPANVFIGKMRKIKENVRKSSEKDKRKESEMQKMKKISILLPTIITRNNMIMSYINRCQSKTA